MSIAFDFGGAGSLNEAVLLRLLANSNTNVLTDDHLALLGQLTVTAATDLDVIRQRVVELDAAIVLKGEWDASAGTFPGSGSAQAGESWIVSTAGSVDGVPFGIGDRVMAITSNAAADTFAANWFKADYTDVVLSVAGLTGAITAAALKLALSLPSDTVAAITGKADTLAPMTESGATTNLSAGHAGADLTLDHATPVLNLQTQTAGVYPDAMLVLLSGPNEIALNAPAGVSVNGVSASSWTVQGYPGSAILDRLTADAWRLLGSATQV